MPKLVCCQCKVHLRPEKNGNIFIETFSSGAPGLIWDSDRWKCPGCGVEILAGFGREPIKEHWQEGFDTVLAAVKKLPFTLG
jgi:hypothetical protein